MCFARLLPLLLRGPYLTPAGSEPAQAWGWACTAGRVAAPTWSCAGEFAYTGSRVWPRGRRSLSSAPYAPKPTSWVWLCGRTEGLISALRIPR